MKYSPFFRLVWRFITNLTLFLLYYGDIIFDIILIVNYYKKNKLDYAIATSLVLTFPTLFMILFYCSSEIFSTNNTKLCKALNSFVYTIIFLAQFHIIIRYNLYFQIY